VVSLKETLSLKFCALSEAKGMVIKMKINITKSRILFVFSSILIIIFLLLSISSCTKTITLYFADNEAFLVKEVRKITVTEEFPKNIIEELIKGPKSSDFYPTLPSNVKVNSIVISGETAIVDFSKEIITNFEEIPHSSTTETLAIYSIVNTLTEFEEIKKVKITIEGKESGEIEGLYVEDFWGHIGIDEEFTRNEDLIEKT